ncbi:MAG: hypothetical protein GF392_02510 [Candidatus Omnitrophica bacterium]|nr:hypothetical protein [Candidatus Omnitrophota bacterium]
MREFVRKISLAFTAGAVGGILNRFVVWLFGYTGISGDLGVNFAPAWSKMFVYTGIVWGGIWGFLFILPLLRRSAALRGILYSIPPTLVMLFVVLPRQMNKGMMGTDLGNMMLVLVVFFNIIWGLGAAYWLKLTGEKI